MCQCSIVLALGFVYASFWLMLEVLSKWLAYQLQEIWISEKFTGVK